MLLVVTPGWGGLILFAGFGLIGIIGFLWLRSSMKYRSESLWKDREGVDYWAIIEELEGEIESLSLQEERNPFNTLSQLQIGFAGLTGGSLSA